MINIVTRPLRPGDCGAPRAHHPAGALSPRSAPAGQLIRVPGRRCIGSMWHHRPGGSTDDDQRARRTTGRALDAGGRGPTRAVVLRGPAGSGRSRAAGGVRDLGTSRLVVQRRVQRGPHRRHDRGDLPLPRGPGNRRPAVHRAATRTRSPGRRSRRRSGCSRRTTSTSASMPRTATRPTPVISHAILVHNRGRRDGLADGIVVTPSHNPPEDGGFKYNPPHGGPADTDVTTWIQDEANRLLEADLEGVRRIPIEHGPRTGHRPRFRDDAMSRISPRSSTWRRSARPGSGSASTRSAARASPTGPPSRRRYDLDLTITNEVVDPPVRLHDRRLGRTDPDGPVLALRDGAPRRAARPVRRRVRQRHRRRPPRDRHARRRTDEPESLPVGRRRVPVWRRTRLANRCRRWQDARLERDARSSGGGSRPPPARGPGRVQVVRRGPARRKPRVRRRGERRGVVPAARRLGLDDRQGRDHRLPAGGRTDGPDRSRPGRGVPGADRTLRRAGLPPHRRAGDARRRRRCWLGCLRRRSRPPSSPANPCSTS